jgi:hypothetical protein
MNLSITQALLSYFGLLVMAIGGAIMLCSWMVKNRH